MIQSKQDLREYLDKDKFALKISRKRPKLLGDEIWKYEIILRKLEYYLNTQKRGGGTSCSNIINLGITY